MIERVRKKQMKKLTAIMLLAAMTTGLMACGDTKTEQKKADIFHLGMIKCST